MKLLVMTEERAQEGYDEATERLSIARKNHDQAAEGRWANRLDGWNAAITAMTEVDLEEMENGARELSGPGLYLAGFHEAIVSLLAYIKEGK